MPKFYALVMQVSKTTYLFVESWEIIQLQYLLSELEVIKVCGEGGSPSAGVTSLQRQHLL
jgi:hypothetical protein